MNLIYPDLPAYDFIHRTLSFEYEDLILPVVEKLRLTPSKSKAYRPDTYFISPFAGKGERSRPDTWRQVIMSLANRNFAAPNINEDHDVALTAKMMFDSVTRLLRMDRISEHFDVIEPCVNKINDWLLTRDSRKFKNILRGMNYKLWSEEVKNMKIMVKGDMKPKLDNSHFSKYAPPSNIVYYQHVINMYFSPIFLEIFSRINYCLPDNVILYSGMNLEELAASIQSKLKNPLETYQYTEIDFSKFDKSQGVIVKRYEELIYKFFKFSPNVYDNFKLSEYFCQAKSASGVAVDLFASRRTGSPNTWLSNSLCTLGMLSMVYDIETVELILISGDDSLIISKEKLPNQTSELNKIFGMESKFQENPCPYFCSKFILSVNNKIVIIPDLVRLYEKLSVPISQVQLEHPTLLRERFTSYRDLLKPYFDLSVHNILDHFLSLRYGHPKFASYASFCYIHVIFSNFQSFRRVFETENVVLI
nr:RNA-dependent RNA polymerase [Agapanthus velarivirus]QVY19226.1 RNA-dependent RNA polymerase [Agapanthus velarivirus]QVY19246.1 RNA-dependent RNA polymerase [Agapanthus velarivirus]QVY47392.1 RNA-dependent RNA polymerase [Agapanthus velarivirus]